MKHKQTDTHRARLGGRRAGYALEPKSSCPYNVGTYEWAVWSNAWEESRNEKLVDNKSRPAGRNDDELTQAL